MRKLQVELNEEVTNQRVDISELGGKNNDSFKNPSKICSVQRLVRSTFFSGSDFVS